MNKTVFLPLVAGLCAPTTIYSATIAFEDFEDSTVGYTTSVADDLSDISNRDYFGRIAPDSSTPPVDVSYSNTQGSGYYGVQDADGANSGDIDDITINFTGILIADYTNLTFSAFFAEDNSTDGNEDWDTTSSVRVLYQIDGGGFNNLFAIESELGIDGNQTNEVPRVDTDFNGVGDGVEITDVFTQFSFPIPNGNTLDIRIEIQDLDTGDEDIAIDNVLIEGDLAIPEPSTALLGSLSLLALLRRRR